MKYKCGTRREDGMVFWRRHKTKGDIWITEEQYKKRTSAEKAYRQRAYEEYKRRLAKKKPDERPTFGQYCPRREKYYLGVSSTGKEEWVTKERLERHKIKSKRNKRKHVERLLKLPKTGLKIGDQNPDNPKEYVVFFIGNKPYFGTLEHLKRVKEARAIAYRKRDIKAKKIRAERLARLENRHRRGDIDPITNKIFWDYDRIAKEIWLDPEIYHRKRQKDLEKRRLNRQKKQK